VAVVWCTYSGGERTERGTYIHTYVHAYVLESMAL